MRDPHLDEGMAGGFEPVQVAEFDDKSALLVDFSKSTATTKTLLDLEEAVLITKSIEPFFLDCKLEYQAAHPVYIYRLSSP